MGITKFTSFVVFLFGILLLLVIAATFVADWLKVPVGSSGLKVRTIPPPCTLAELNVGTGEQFMQMLDSLYERGGLDAVRDYVEKELVPGRLIVITSMPATDPPVEMMLIDREVRRCDLEGSVVLSVAPVLSRATAVPVMADDVKLTSWLRLQVKEPFVITTWWVQRTQ